MKIGVVGTGNIGGTLARKLSAAGHDVRVANSRGLQGVGAFADAIGATAVDTRGVVDSGSLFSFQICKCRNRQTRTAGNAGNIFICRYSVPAGPWVRG